MRYRGVRAGLIGFAALMVAVGLTGVAKAATKSAALVSDPASVVDARVMSTGGGNDFPGVDMPFGMVQWSPDTSPSRPLGGGYSFNATQFRGFSLTHMAGPGCGAMQDLPILPMTGGLPSGDPGTHMEPFTHTGEVAQAGFYSVMSGAGSNIKTELTATMRSAMARWTFPATSQADLLIKLRDSQNGTSASTVTVVGTNEVHGSATSGHFCGAADTYTVHFDIIFDHPFAATACSSPSTPRPTGWYRRRSASPSSATPTRRPTGRRRTAPGSTSTRCGPTRTTPGTPC